MTARHSPSSLLPHAPVMLHEMLAALDIESGKRIVDGTFGAGGYSRAILETADCHVYAIDRDGYVEAFVNKLKQDFDGRFVFLPGNFSQMVELLAAKGIEKVDGVVLDIGVSSMQLDTAERGFSFRYNASLDMRMAQTGISAADVVNNAAEEELADIISRYGEEKAAKRIAKAIVKKRAEKPIETTRELSALISSVLGRGNGKIDPATRTFQALRIHVNDELGELVRALEAAEKILVPGGRLVVVTFHSLEDRIVKRFFQSRTGANQENVSRHVPVMDVANKTNPSFRQEQRKAILAGDAEIAVNPRARSAKLRWAVRTEAPIINDRAFAEV